jgi:diguanylate cyclase (GGDEF)-like protein/PAS domain S-box-containing protein
MSRPPGDRFNSGGVVAVGGGLLALFFLLPYSAARDGVFDLTGLFAAAAMAWAVRRHRPEPARPWWLITASSVLLCAGDIAYDVSTHVFGIVAFPSVVDVFYLASYPVLAYGVAGALRTGDRRRDTTALLDALFAALAFGVLVLVLFVEPMTSGNDPFLKELVSTAYPAMDVMLLAILARLVLISRPVTPAARWLIASLALELVADLVYARLELFDIYVAGSPVDAVFLVAYLCRTLAAVHPSMRSLAGVDGATGRPDRARLWLVGAAALILPGVCIGEALLGDTRDIVMVAAASALGFVILTARSGTVLRSLRVALTRNRDLLDRERTLRALGTALATTSDRYGIHQAAVDSAGRLAGPGGEALLFLGRRELRILAASAGLRSMLGSEFSATVLPEATVAQLTAGAATIIGPAGERPIPGVWPASLDERSLVIAPITSRSGLSGAVIAAPLAGQEPAELLDALESLGATVSIALEAADLAEDLLEQRSQERFRAMLENSSDVVALLRPDLTVQFVGASVRRILGWEAPDIVGRSIADFLDPDEVPAAKDALAAAVLTPGVYGPFSCRVRHRDGSWRLVEAMGTNLLDDPAVNGVVVNIRDVTERAHLQEALSHQAFHDSLTGLANRALFHDRVQHALSGSGRSGRSVEILFLDLDDFKSVNDGLGHRIGDAVLVTVAERLVASVRPGDTVARLGGDEFAVLLDGSVAGGLVAERIVEALRAPVGAEGQEVLARASIGIAAAEPGAALADLLRDADLAMYVAKAQGKDRWVDFRPEMLEGFLDDLQLERDLRQALPRNEIQVHYQPVVDLATEEIVGAEALVRWMDPQRGRVSPAVFIPTAERSGLIVPIGRHVLHQACHDTARWVRTQPARRFSVSVNVSARQLREPSLVEEVRGVLAETGLPPDRLVVEVTESLLLDDLDATVERLGALRHLGVRVSIDDFGTGYSSLSYLGQLPVDILKIDKSFVDGVAEDDRPSLVPAILEVSRTLGLSTIAEGVEHAEQADRLRELGCPFAQGFHYSPPVPAGQMEHLLATAAFVATTGAR